MSRPPRTTTPDPTTQPTRSAVPDTPSPADAAPLQALSTPTLAPDELWRLGGEQGQRVVRRMSQTLGNRYVQRLVAEDPRRASVPTNPESEAGPQDEAEASQPPNAAPPAVTEADSAAQATQAQWQQRAQTEAEALHQTAQPSVLPQATSAPEPQREAARAVAAPDAAERAHATLPSGTLARPQPDPLAEPLQSLSDADPREAGQQLAQLAQLQPQAEAEQQMARQAALPPTLAVAPTPTLEPMPALDAAPTREPTSPAAQADEAPPLPTAPEAGAAREVSQKEAAHTGQKMTAVAQADTLYQKDAPERAVTQSAVPVTAGPRPTIPLAGASNPARLDAQKTRTEGMLAARRTQGVERLHRTDFGEQDLRPTLPMPPLVVEGEGDREPPAPPVTEAEALATALSAPLPLAPEQQAEMDSVLGATFAEQGALLTAAHAEHQAEQQAQWVAAEEAMQVQVQRHLEEVDQKQAAIQQEAQATVGTMRETWQGEQEALHGELDSRAATLHQDTRALIAAEVQAGETRMAEKMTQTEAQAATRKSEREGQAQAAMDTGRSQASGILAGVGLGMGGQYEANAVQHSGILQRSVDEMADNQQTPNAEEQEQAEQEAQTTVDTAVAEAQAILDTLLAEVRALLDEMDQYTGAEREAVEQLIAAKMAEVNAILEMLDEEAEERGNTIAETNAATIRDYLATVQADLDREIGMARIVTFSHDEGTREWTAAERRMVREASWQVATRFAEVYNAELPAEQQMAPADVFLGVYGANGVNFNLATSDCTDGFACPRANTETENDIDLYANILDMGVAQTVEGSSLLLHNPNLIIHELGHAFDNAVLDRTGDSPVLLQWAQGFAESREGLPGRFATYGNQLQQSSDLSDEEVFADSFLAWVRGAPMGPGRTAWLNDNLPTWIRETVSARTGVEATPEAEETPEGSTEAPIVTPTPTSNVTQPDVRYDVGQASYVINTDAANLRPTYSTDGTPLASVPRGTAITVLGHYSLNDSWKFIRVNSTGQEGWMSGSYVQ